MKKLFIILLSLLMLTFSSTVLAEEEKTSAIEDLINNLKTLDLSGGAVILPEENYSLAFGVKLTLYTTDNNILSVNGHYITDFNANNDINDKYGLAGDLNFKTLCIKYCKKIKFTVLANFLKKVDMDFGIGVALDAKKLIENKELDTDLIYTIRLVKLW